MLGHEIAQVGGQSGPGAAAGRGPGKQSLTGSSLRYRRHEEALGWFCSYCSLPGMVPPGSEAGPKAGAAVPFIPSWGPRGE